MPQKKSGKKGYAKGLGDVTLNDFANSSVPKNRLKKSSNNVSTVLKVEIAKSWDEKDEEEFEGEFVAQENEDGSVSYVIQKVEPRVRKKTLSSSDKKGDKKEDNGKDYPIDIWFLLSEYIRPEDVGTFALICRTSFEVVCTARFWFGLYRRYYKSVPNMPEHLQPECLIRKYGLRANVIRALYHMYPPFVDHIKPITTFEEHPDSLKKYECYILWYTMKKNENYTYYFKMKKKILSTLSHSNDKQGPDLLEILDDVSANPDEHCRILEVSCLYFSHVPPVIGLTLTSVSLTLSSAPKYRYHRLQLGFGSGITTTSKSKGGADLTTVILDPVINVRVLDWWHPLYPHSHNMEELISLGEK